MTNRDVPAPDPRLLIDYVDGVLAPDEARRVERLVETNGAWRAELELARSFANEPAAEAPEDVRAKAWAVIDPDVVPIASRRRSWFPALLAAASLAMIFVAGRTWWEMRPIGDETTMRSVAGESDVPLLVVPVENGWRLQWDPPVAVSGVRLVVTDAAGRVVCQEDVPPPNPPFLGRTTLESSAGPLVVRLVAVGPDGQEVRSALAPLPR